MNFNAALLWVITQRGRSAVFLGLKRVVRPIVVLVSCALLGIDINHQLPISDHKSDISWLFFIVNKSITT